MKTVPLSVAFTSPTLTVALASLDCQIAQSSPGIPELIAVTALPLPSAFPYQPLSV